MTTTDDADASHAEWLAAINSGLLPDPEPPTDPEWDLPAPNTYKAPDTSQNGSEADDADDHSTWWPHKLGGLFDGSTELPEPELCQRTDGMSLVYPAKAHAFNGESESGKSWAALHACVQAVTAGKWVLYLDFEDTAQTVVARLLALGADPAAIMERFAYADPTEPLATGQQQRFTAANTDWHTWLDSHIVDLAIIDGVTEAMTLHGMDLNSNQDYALWHALIIRRLNARGAATIQIDHVTKSGEGRGRYALGAQHKLAGIDGAVYSFTPVKPMGLGRHGVAKIEIGKDRPGQLRQHARGNHIADLHVDSHPDTHALKVTLERPESHEDEDITDIVWQFISDANRAGGEPSQRAIRAGVTGNVETIKATIEELVKAGRVVTTTGPNRTIQHRVIYQQNTPNE
jgi:hypothetical protein